MNEAESYRENSPPQIPLIDPTANVLSLVEAAIKRQDDLRDAARQLEDERIKRLDQVQLMAEHCAQEIAAVHLQAERDLALAESKRIDALTLAESRRLDALLAAASGAVALASEKAAAQAATLQQQVVTSAHALQAQATTSTTSLEARITLLEQSRYTIGGRDEQRGETRQGTQWGIAIAVSIGGLALAILGTGIAIMTRL